MIIGSLRVEKEKQYKVPGGFEEVTSLKFENG